MADLWIDSNIDLMFLYLMIAFKLPFVKQLENGTGDKT